MVLLNEPPWQPASEKPSTPTAMPQHLTGAADSHRGAPRAVHVVARADRRAARVAVVAAAGRALDDGVAGRAALAPGVRAAGHGGGDAAHAHPAADRGV